MSKDKVLVPKDSLPRCGWCGSYYSPEWIRSVRGMPEFCSKECWDASRIGNSGEEIMQSKGSLCFSFSLIIIFVFLLVYDPVRLEIWIIGILVALWLFCVGFEIAKRNRDARKYLYRKDLFRDSYPLLIECGFCSHLNPPDTLDCQYCDASLAHSQSVDGQIPDWFESKESKIQRKCPHCGAIYGYDLTIEKEMLLCQNCAKQFPVSKED